MIKYIYFTLLTIGLLFILLKFGCKEKKVVSPPQIEIVDSNVIRDRISDYYGSKLLLLYDSIDFLNNSVKRAKIVYKTKIVQVWSDSVITIEECSDVVSQANIIISSQDSLIQVQSKGLEVCDLQINNLQKQVKINREYSEKLLLRNVELSSDNEKLKVKVKRNRLFTSILSSIVVSLILIK